MWMNTSGNVSCNASFIKINASGSLFLLFDTYCECYTKQGVFIVIC